MPINYLEIFKNAWSITWKHKFLWWFGLLIALSEIFGTLNQLPADETSSRRVENFILDNQEMVFTVAAILFLIFAIFSIVGFLGRGALIKSIGKILHGQGVDFKDGLKDGKKYFWKLIAISVVVGLLTISILTVVLLPIIFFFYSQYYVSGIILSLLAVAIIIPSLFIAAFLGIFGSLYAVLGDLRVFDALENAYNLLKQNVGAAIIMTLIFLAIGIMLGIICAIPFFMLGLAFLAVGAALYAAFGTTGAVIAAVGFCLIFFPISLFVRSVYATFSQVAWVLFFEAIAKPKVEEKIAEPMAEEKPLATPDMA